MTLEMDLPPPPPPPRQLPLPLPFAPPVATPSPPPLAEVVIRPPTLWRRLTPDLRAQARRTLVRICQEVLDADP
jgi:hypothetical protein